MRRLTASASRGPLVAQLRDELAQRHAQEECEQGQGEERDGDGERRPERERKQAPPHDGTGRKPACSSAACPCAPVSRSR